VRARAAPDRDGRLGQAVVRLSGLVRVPAVVRGVRVRSWAWTLDHVAGE
jgi:hypothetical protein